MWEKLLEAVRNYDPSTSYEKCVLTEKLIDSMPLEEVFNRDYSKLDYKQIPLHIAIYYSKYKLIEKLLYKSPELINAVDINGYTALRFAILYGN